MSYASKQGRARVSSSSPEAAGQCDRCGFVYSFRSLQWQFDWRGAALMNTRILVCRHCLDKPQEQLRAIVVPADPVPIMNARVPDFIAAETDYRVVSVAPTIDPITGLPFPPTIFRATEDGNLRITQSIGVPTGLEQPGIPKQFGAAKYNRPLDLLSVVSDSLTNIVSATTSSPHGLAINDTISAEGLANPLACGFWPVASVASPMAFSWAITFPIGGQSLLTGATRIVQALVGIPPTAAQLPLTGVAE